MGEKDKHNFKTPEGYFDSFNERLMARLHHEQADNALSFLPKSDGFDTPDSYFDDLEKKVLDKIPQKETKVIRFQTYRKLYYGVAAIAAIFIIFFGLNIKSESPIAFEDLASAEIDAYLEYAEFNLSSYELAELVPLESTELNDVMDTPLESENILEYLDENIEDIEELNLNLENYE